MLWTRHRNTLYVLLNAVNHLLRVKWAWTVRRVEYHHSQISIWSQEQSSRAGKREKRRKRQKIHPADMLVKQCRKSRISTPLHTHSSIHYITDYFILFFPFPSLAFVFSTLRTTRFLLNPLGILSPSRFPVQL